MNADSYVKEFRVNNYSRFNEFYNLTYKNVYFTALAVLNDRSLAEDITQDTFVAFLETIDSYRLGANVLSYLSVIARNKSINLYLKDKKTVYDETALTDIKFEVDYTADTGAEEILNLLSDNEEREIVTYHVILGYKFIEIAGILKKPLGTVLWRYNKALKTLREKVGDDYE